MATFIKFYWNFAVKFSYSNALFFLLDSFSTGNCTQPSSGVVSTAGSTPGLSDLPRYPWMALTGGNYTVYCFFASFFLILFPISIKKSLMSFKYSKIFCLLTVKIQLLIAMSYLYSCCIHVCIPLRFFLVKNISIEKLLFFLKKKIISWVDSSFFVFIFIKFSFIVEEIACF